MPDSQPLLTYCPALQTELFVLVPDNRALVTGQAVRIPYIGNSALRLFLIVLTVTFVIAAVTLFQAARQMRLNDTGLSTRTEATVVSQRITKDAYDNPDGWYITYSYTVSGKPFRAESKISADAYNEMKVGSRVTVQYDQADPSNVRLAEIRMVIDTGPAVGTMIGLAITLFLFGLASREQRLNRALRTGHLIGGVLENISGESDEGNYTVTARFKAEGTLDGSPFAVTGKDSAQRNDLDDKRLPAVGTPLAIWYMGQRARARVL